MLFPILEIYVAERQTASAANSILSIYFFNKIWVTKGSHGINEKNTSWTYLLNVEKVNLKRIIMLPLI